MRKTTAFQSCFLSLLPVAYLGLTSLGCMKTDSLGLAGNNDSGMDGIAPNGGSTGKGETTVPASGGTPSTCGATGSSSLLDMLPADNEVGTWAQTGGVQLITDQTGLYKRVDGAAPKYIDRGWVSSAYTNYSQGSRIIQAAIHDMGTVANAQAIYNYALPATRLAIPGRANAVADLGLATAYVAYAYLDRFYVELNISERDDAALTSIELFMKDLLDRTSNGCPDAGPSSTRNPVAWTTPTVSLAADDFWIVADGQRFTGKGAVVDVHSDPGDPTYTTLELVWTELGREMRFFIYFHADPTGWWSDEMRTYNGQVTNPDWLYYDGMFFKSAIGATFRGDVDLTNAADDPFRGELHLHGLVLSATLSGGAGVVDAGAVDANAACASQPLTQEQATVLFRDFVYQDIPTYNPDSVFSVEELQVPGAWDAMGIQLFSGGTVDDYGYVINTRPFVTLACKLYPLTKWSATGLLSAVLVDSKLYYTVRAGSGINYAELGRISLSDSGPQILKGADYGRSDSLNLYLRESGGQIVVELGDGMKFNSWSALQVFGWLRDDGASLVVVDAAGTVIPYNGVGGW